MRRLILGVVVVSSLLILNFSVPPDFERATISGMVRSPSGDGITGVLVRAINTDRRISVSVFTQTGGYYRADSLFPGAYEVRAELKGFESAISRNVRANGHVTLDLILKKPAVATASLTSGDVFSQFPEDKDKNLVVDTCFRCHSMLSFLKERRGREEWDKLVRRMAPRRRADITDEEMTRVVDYFSRYFDKDIPHGVPFMDAPEASPGILPVRIIEYSIPEQEPPEIIVPSTNSAPIYPHNITVTPEGIVWFAMYKTNRIGRLDPRTGQFRNYLVPTPGSVPHGITFSRDGMIWFTEARGNKVGRLNPMTGEIIEIPTNSGGNTIVEDSKGNMYLTMYGTNQIGKVNTRTLESTAYDLLTPNAMPYGIVVDQKDRVWWTQLLADTIGRLDTQTGEITEYPTPTKLSGPRRLSVDHSGVIWFTEWLANKLGKLDPETGEIIQYELPTPSSEAYDVRVDAQNRVWVAGYLSNTLALFDRTTESFKEYPLPTPRGEIRKMAADPERGVWFAQSHTDVIGHIYIQE